MGVLKMNKDSVRPPLAANQCPHTRIAELERENAALRAELEFQHERARLPLIEVVEIVAPPSSCVFATLQRRLRQFIAWLKRSFS